VLSVVLVGGTRAPAGSVRVPRGKVQSDAAAGAEQSYNSYGVALAAGEPARSRPAASLAERGCL
jgi:hypothetical protein